MIRSLESMCLLAVVADDWNALDPYFQLCLYPHIDKLKHLQRMFMSRWRSHMEAIAALVTFLGGASMKPLGTDDGHEVLQDWRVQSDVGSGCHHHEYD